MKYEFEWPFYFLFVIKMINCLIAVQFYNSKNIAFVYLYYCMVFTCKSVFLKLIKDNLAVHSGKCYVVRVGKNLKEYPYDNDFDVIWFVHFARSHMQIFMIISLPV